MMIDVRKYIKTITTGITTLKGFWLVFFISFVLYVSTAAPTIGPIDAGELSLAVGTLGIAHPTGYPLYTILGRSWTLFLATGDLAWRLNIFSSLVAAAVSALFFLLLVELELPFVLALGGALLWVVSPSAWEQSNFLEVYGLTTLLGLLIIGLAVKYRTNRNHKLLWLAGFIAGLGLGNHMTLLWYLTGGIVLIWEKPDKSVLKNWLGLLFFFCLGISVYLYLPLRSSLEPLHNWGDPSNWQRFWWHITGKQYRVWMFSREAAGLWRSFTAFVKLAASHPTVCLSWLSVPGAIYLFRKNKRLLLALVLTLVSSVIYGINYSIPDINSYYLPALAVSSLLICLGAYWCYQFTVRINRPVLSLAVKLFFLIVPLVVMFFSYNAHNRRNDVFMACFANDIMVSASPGGVILTDNWDVYASVSYLQQRQNLRPDLIIIDKELLRRRWYYRYLEKRYPDYFTSCRPEIEEFLPYLHMFEQGEKYDPMEIQAKYLKMLNAFLLRNYYDRQPYLTERNLKGDYSGIASQYERIPEGLLYALKLPGSGAEICQIDTLFSQPFTEKDIKTLADREHLVMKFYAKMLYERGMYLAQNMLYQDALPYFQRAVFYDVRQAGLYVALGGAYTSLNQVEAAIESFNQALALDPDNQVAKTNLDYLKMFTPGGPKHIRQELR